MRRVATIGLVLLLLAGPAGAEPSQLDERLRIRRKIEALNAQFLQNDSATAVLQALCDRRAPGQKIVARKTERPTDASTLDAARAALGAAPEEPVRHRQVELMCAGEVLSQAENWYLPGRLTPEMNRALDETRTPFGVVVAPLHFRREFLETVFLHEARAPLREGERLTASDPVLRHRAILKTPDGGAFSLLVETYTSEVLR